MSRLDGTVSLTLDCPKLRTVEVSQLWELDSCVLVSSAISDLMVSQCPSLDASSMIVPTLESIDLMETFVSNTETGFHFKLLKVYFSQFCVCVLEWYNLMWISVTHVFFILYNLRLPYISWHHNFLSIFSFLDHTDKS